MIIGITLITLTWTLFAPLGCPIWGAAILTVLGAFILIFGLLFGVYFFNIDQKALVYVQRFLLWRHDKKKTQRRI